MRSLAVHLPVHPARLRGQSICRGKATTATLIAVEPPLPSVVIDGGAALQKAVVIVREAPEIFFCCQWVVSLCFVV